MEQVAVGRVNFKDLKTGGRGTLRRFAKRFHYFAEFSDRERTRNGIVLIKRFRARRDGFPASLLWRDFFCYRATERWYFPSGLNGQAACQRQVPAGG